jgi:hypothetical protein
VEVQVLSADHCGINNLHRFPFRSSFIWEFPSLRSVPVPVLPYALANAVESSIDGNNSVLNITGALRKRTPHADGLAGRAATARP